VTEQKGSSSDLAAAVERLRGDLRRPVWGPIDLGQPYRYLNDDLRLVLDALDQWRDDANRLAAALRAVPICCEDCRADLPEAAALDAHDQMAGGDG
jgi:hypothetical protein